MSVSPPTLPKNISIISITRDTADRPLVMPSVSPTVPIAELVSNRQVSSGRFSTLLIMIPLVKNNTRYINKTAPALQTVSFDILLLKHCCSLPRKTQKTDTQNEKSAPEHHVQERFLLPINGVSPLFYPFNFSSILATCRKICLSVSLLLVSFSVSSFGLSVVVVAFFENPFSPAALIIAG